MPCSSPITVLTLGVVDRITVHVPGDARHNQGRADRIDKDHPAAPLILCLGLFKVLHY
jgi:hypothetical protein